MRYSRKMNKTNDWLVEINDKDLLDPTSNSSKELQRIKLKTLRLKKDPLKLYDLRGDSYDEPQESKKIPDNGHKWHKLRFWRRLRADPDIKEKQLERSPTLPYQNLTINADLLCVVPEERR